MIKVRNMTSSRGNEISNQFIIEDDNFIYFQSYDSVIVKKDKRTREITLDERYWNYSVTTGKYRNLFLYETKKETERKIKEGIYKLDNLN